MTEHVEPHDPAWAAAFAIEAGAVRASLGDVLVDLHHMAAPLCRAFSPSRSST
jgi:GrpB-like predicted nucleotidyltransferase (UPF0157 family)